MAKTVYVNGTAGNNSWDGLSPTYVSGTNGPKKTIVGARAATVAGDLVLIAPGVFLETWVAFSSINDNNTLYRKDPTLPGKVVVDWENSPASNSGASAGNYNSMWMLTYKTCFLDIHFRNVNSGKSNISSVNSSNVAKIMHCVFHQRDGGANTGVGVGGFNSTTNYTDVWNCSFYNLALGVHYAAGNHFNNYFNSVTTPFTSAGINQHNAYPGAAGVGDINTNTTDPGFEDAVNEDFRLDPDTTPADWAALESGGYQGGSIGAWGQGGWIWDPTILQLRLISAAPTFAQGNPQPAWENEGPNGTNTYTAGTPGDIIEDPVNYDAILDLATTPAATGGRVRTDVINMGSAQALLRSISYAGFEDLPVGAAFDINTTTPFQQEYRSLAISFLKGDGSPAWTVYARGDDIDQAGHCYAQLRITMRTDHTNAA